MKKLPLLLSLCFMVACKAFISNPSFYGTPHYTEK